MNIGLITGQSRLSSLYTHTVFILDVKNVLVCHDWYLLYFAHMRTETRGFPEHISYSRNNFLLNSLDFFLILLKWLRNPIWFRGISLVPNGVWLFYWDTAVCTGKWPSFFSSSTFTLGISLIALVLGWILAGSGFGSYLNGDFPPGVATRLSINLSPRDS